MNIEKLVKQKRLIPVYEKDKEGVFWLIGYKRRASSRKKGHFKLPKPVKALNSPNENAIVMTAEQFIKESFDLSFVRK